MKDKLLLASKSLTGISIGDAFGESFFGEESMIRMHIHQRIIPESTLDFTDDTIMAIAVFKSLENSDKSIRIFWRKSLLKIIILILIEVTDLQCINISEQ
jgi:ADP-ribosylglycohydrolase